MRSVPAPRCCTVLQTHFLALLPRIETHGRIYFRHLKCPHQKADALQEMRSLAWQWFLQLAERRKDPAEFVAAFATLLARAVRSGRRLAGMEKAKDALNPLSQRRHGFTVSPLPDASTLNGNVFDEALADNTQTPVPEQVAFRGDFPSWRRTRTRRDRRLLDDLMRGERTTDVSRKYGLCPARVSQLRRAFHADWTRFCADPGDFEPAGMA